MNGGCVSFGSLVYDEPIIIKNYIIPDWSDIEIEKLNDAFFLFCTENRKRNHNASEVLYLHVGKSILTFLLRKNDMKRI